MDYAAVPAIVKLRTESLTGQQNHLPQKINIIPCFQRWIRSHTSTQRFMADFRSLWRRFFFRLLTTLMSHHLSSIRKYSYTEFSAQRMDDKCEWALLRFSRQRSVCSTSDMLKFRRRCPTILYWTALRKHPNVRKQVGRSRLSPGPWPRKQKNPDNLKQLTPPQLSLPSMLRCRLLQIFPAASCSFFQVWTQSAACSRPPKLVNKTNIFFRDRAILFLRRVMCFSSHPVMFFSMKSLQSKQPYSPELIDRSLRLLCFNDSKWLERTRTLYQWIHNLKHAIQQKYCHFYISSQLL